MIKKLYSILTKRDKKLLVFLVVFSLFISLIELIGISAIMPFISIATDFSIIQKNDYYKYVYDFFGFTSTHFFVIAFGIILVFFYIFRSLINIGYFYSLNRFSNGRYHLIVYRLFENYLGMNYKDFIKQNSSYLTKTIVTEANYLTSIIQNFLFMISEIFVIILLYSMMVYVNYKITLILTIILILNAFFLTKTVSKKIKTAGARRAEIQKRFYEIINRTFGNYKLIKLNSKDSHILKEFHTASYGFAQANTKAQTLQQFPRLFLEAIGFSMIVLIITFLVWKYQQNIANILATISMFVLALYRLMPSVNRIMNSYNTIMFNYKSLDIIHNELMYDSENLGFRKVDFNQQIKLENIYFEYESEKTILCGINLEIEKGEKIALVGESGGGKSTLVDLIIGLYKPALGSIIVDNEIINEINLKDWRQKIGYIPQSVYLFDGTVADNIVFGREYDEEKIIDCLKKANIFEFLSKKDGIQTLVGEGGIMLSGGQKQRIAIARALYGNPEVLVLDEATSALDNETEALIMDEIYKVSQNKTLIIIAHRLSTIERCDKIYKIEEGKIVNA